MDYVDALLIMEDSVEDSDTEVENSEDTENRQCNDDQQRTPSQAGQQLPPAWQSSEPPPEWCKCGNCRSMSQEIENVCCKERKCITEQARFQKVSLDADVTVLCKRNSNEF